VNTDIEARLVALHEEYTSAINEAIGEGRDELVNQLAAEFPDAALELMSGGAAQAA
jgi:hypothetical protein